MKDIKTTLRKLQHLADGTNFEHEKASALKKLNELMKKYGFIEADLNDEAVLMHNFKWRGKFEKQLLAQIIYKVLNTQEFKTYAYKRNGRNVSNMIAVKCTIGQKVEIDFLFDFYKKLYKQEEKVFQEAFVIKHEIYGETAKEEKEISEEDYMKMQCLMEGMKDVSPQRRIMAKE